MASRAQPTFDLPATSGGEGLRGRAWSQRPRTGRAACGPKQLSARFASRKPVVAGPQAAGSIGGALQWPRNDRFLSAGSTGVDPKRASTSPNWAPDSGLSTVDLPHIRLCPSNIDFREPRAVNAQHFDAFKQYIDSGRRTEAARSIADFVDSFADLEEKIAWTRDYLATEGAGHLVRHELYEQVVFPPLLDGLSRSESWSLWGLARTAQNLYRSDKLWRQVNYMNAQGFLDRLLVQCPGDEKARKALLAALIDGMRYAIHEWPSGILYTHNGATLDECADILQDVAKARELDREQMHSTFLADFERKVGDYMARLQPAR